VALKLHFHDRTVMSSGSSIVLLLLSGCFSKHPSDGGGHTTFSGSRQIRAEVASPAAYRIEPVARGLTFPPGVAFDADDRPYVVDAGYSYAELFRDGR
jgi:hypothetical protein